MSDRARSRPPELPGFTYDKWLGGGGFADVFLYRQHRPSRPVAVKVLRADGLPPEARASFDVEADLMAEVSAHPYIVTIYDTDVAPDGRPYLVMQYYPNPHYGQRARGRGLDVVEVLSVGVRIASAVETAHRASILHRDIKPANILVSEYNRPGLTDFGIAGTREGAAAEAHGVTYAYAPPEVLASDEPGDERADVYSLAATLYALLAGRAPFEQPSGDNSTRSIAVRTLNDPLPPVRKPDVPQSLELLLQHAMAKRPGDRPPSAAAFARGLQAVEQELQLAPTEFEVAVIDAGASPRPAPEATAEDDGEATRSGRLQVVRPEVPRATAPASPVTAAAAVPAFDGSALIPEAPPLDDTIERGTRSDAPPSGPQTGGVDVANEASGKSPAGRKTPIGLLVGASTALVLIGGGIAFAASSSGGRENPATTTTLPGDDALVIGSAPSAPTDVRVVVSNGVATVTWTATAAEDGDSYLVARVDGAHREEPAVPADAPTLTVPNIDPAETPCFEVTAERSGRLSEPSARGCPG